MPRQDSVVVFRIIPFWVMRSMPVTAKLDRDFARYWKASEPNILWKRKPISITPSGGPPGTFHTWNPSLTLHPNASTHPQKEATVVSRSGELWAVIKWLPG